MPAPDVAVRGADDRAIAAGLDALDTPTPTREPLWRRAAAVSVPPLLALAAFLAVWQALWASALWPEYQLPAPADVWAQFLDTVTEGRLLDIVWTSVGRAIVVQV